MPPSPTLPPIQPVARLSALVTRFLGYNPGPKTLQGTNSYLVGGGSRRVLIDTTNPGKPEYVHQLIDYLKGNQCTLSHILLTHWHVDHVGSVFDVVRACQDEGWEPPITMKLPYKRELSYLRDVKVQPLHDNQIIEIGDGRVLQALHTPGHAEDHLCFLMQPENILFSGDIILGTGTTTVQALRPYMDSLERLKSICCSEIYPAHSEIVSPDVIDQYIAHRSMRENQVITFLQSRGSGTIPTMVAQIYVGLDENLVTAAGLNVYAHLIKLLAEQRAEPVGKSASEVRVELPNLEELSATSLTEDLIDVIMDTSWRLSPGSAHL